MYLYMHTFYICIYVYAKNHQLVIMKLIRFVFASLIFENFNKTNEKKKHNPVNEIHQNDNKRVYIKLQTPCFT